jgi:hypothetical protein
LTPEDVATLVARIVNEPATFANGTIVRLNANGAEMGVFEFSRRIAIEERQIDA